MMSKAEQIGGELLDKVMRCSRLSLAECLSVAIKVAEALRQIHAANIIHKYITPSNIIWNSQSGQLRLLGSGIASLSENDGLAAYTSTKGSLPYISPEQTGRTTRIVDYRTDFYSLGIVLYEMLTGRLPFEARDANEMVYCHIAREAIPPHLFDDKIPEAVSGIVTKLMAKMPEDRYQSARGLCNDLSRCIEQLRRQGKINLFPLGRNDASENLHISQKLYGRNREIETLFSAFKRVAAGSKEMVLVAGYAGIGKTVLVDEVRGKMVAGRGLFASGKYDQYTRNIPYSAIVCALGALMRQLLSGPEESLQKWKAALVSALKADGKVIIDVVPELELLIGAQPKLEPLDPVQSRNRFRMVFQRFIRVFARQDHPLIIFLDDLQWVDLASLDLLKDIMTDPENCHLLIIGAYRDNEVPPEHHLLRAVDDIRKGSGCVLQLKVGPVGKQSIDELLADTFHADLSHMDSLGRLLLDKTAGNPFFLKQFLRTLYDAHLVGFDEERQDWAWNIKDIVSRNITDNVADLMISRLHLLPGETQNVLNLAACIGNQFDLDTLSIISGNSSADLLQRLMVAVESGYLLPLDETGSSTETEVTRGRRTPREFKFLHDHVQQAAYSLVDPYSRKEVHAMIGRLMLKTFSAAEVDMKVFQVVKQLNAGHEFLSDEESVSLARLNLNAGRKAKASTAYHAAYQYFQTGRALLSDDSWQSSYELMFDLYTGLTETAYLNQEFEGMERFAGVAIDKALTILDKVQIYEIKIQALAVQNRYVDGLSIGLESLHLLGIEIPSNVNLAEVIELLKNTKTELDKSSSTAILQTASFNDPSKMAAMRILACMISISYFARPLIFPFVVCKGIELSRKYGNSIYTSIFYVNYGLILCGPGVADYSSGSRYGELGEQLFKKHPYSPIHSLIMNNLHSYITPWHLHARQALAPLKESYHIGLEAGEHEFSIYSIGNYLRLLAFVGTPLPEVYLEYEKFIPKISQLKNWGLLYFVLCCHQTNINLMSTKGDSPWEINGEIYHAQEMLTLHEKSGLHVGILIHHSSQLMLAYLFGKYELAQQAIEQGIPYVFAVAGVHPVMQFVFYAPLALLAALNSDTGVAAVLEKVQVWQNCLKQWAENAPMNYQHKYDLVEAEKARVQSNFEKAIKYYEKAIHGARENRYLQDEALSCELAGKFLVNRGITGVGATYLREARSLYLRWGASRKVADLEGKYPEHLPHLQEFGAGDDLTGAGIDLHSVIKASQAISSIIELRLLLSKVMAIVIENTGAQQGSVILVEDGGLRVVVFNEGLNEMANGNQPVPLDSASNVSPAIVNYVMRTREALVLDDAASDEQFSADQYIKQTKPRSILSLPIVRKDNLLGVIYLENNLTTGAFSKERLQVVDLLASQVGISIENARLFDEKKAFAEHLEAEIFQRKRAEALEQELLVKLERAARLESLGVLAGGVAHDLNNVLGPIVVLPDMVTEYVKRHEDQSDPEYADTLEALEVLKNSALRAKAVVSDLVVMGRRGQIQKVPLELNLIVEEVLDSKQIKVMLDRWPHVHIEKKLTGESTGCLGLASRLSRVLENMVGNAVEAVEGAGAITIRTDRKVYTEPYHGYEDVPAGTYITIEISDTGCGMDSKTMVRLFEPFFSTKNPSERSGSGLGLSVVYGLVKDHDGFLDVKSEPGKGATFTVYLPAVDTAALTGPIEPRAAGGNERILVVDDEPGQQVLSKRVLKTLGYEATVVSSGEEAVKLFEEAGREGKPAPYDLVITDMVMGGIDGLTMCREIQQLNPDQKVLIASGHSEEAKELQAKAMGADWLVKPYTAEELARAVRLRLDR